MRCSVCLCSRPGSTFFEGTYLEGTAIRTHSSCTHSLMHSSPFRQICTAFLCCAGVFSVDLVLVLMFGIRCLMSWERCIHENESTQVAAENTDVALVSPGLTLDGCRHPMANITALFTVYRSNAELISNALRPRTSIDWLADYVNFCWVSIFEVHAKPAHD